MQNIVEITQDGRHLSLFRGFLKISEGQEELARVPLDSIDALLMNCYRATLSQNILVTCAEQGIPVILCSNNHQPAGILWPVTSHHKQAGNIQAQLECSKPLAKQLWRQLVQAKILAQHEILQHAHPHAGEALLQMSKRIRSGDPENIEAQAARRYWPQLMGNEFTRNRKAENINSLLNYGYAILRATVARAVMASGLHPSLGVHHKNRLNAFCLVDDVMEPYRPMVDYHVWNLHRKGLHEVNTETKQALAALMEWQVIMPTGRTTIHNATLQTVQSLARSFTAKKPILHLPEHCIPQPQEIE